MSFDKFCGDMSCSMIQRVPLAPIEQHLPQQWCNQFGARYASEIKGLEVVLGH